MLLSLLLSVCIIIFIFFLALSFKCFFFPFSVLESLARWAVSSFSSSSTSSTPSSSLLVWRRTRPPIGDHRQKEKKRRNLVVNLNRRYRLYIWQWLRWTAKTCLTIRFLMAGKVCRHFFFLLFFFCRTALGIVLFCFCCHYRPVMASWCGASSILFMTPGLRLSSVF